ncbi:PREDICTED: duodenase-1-like [Acanthisitta chloris]|uniref:duodenase-1-like n=1 Tax=Acanthisitta chloris TaxID=57068 RepID=UPI0004F0ED07|nr:PREDICTED: duodenase-1-like [Acanthisitta chloris]
MAYLRIQHVIGDKTRTSSCGGFLIQPDAVLSAAHCVKVNITVILGAHNINSQEPTQQQFHVGHWAIHPDYSDETYLNDIMLLKLQPKAKWTKYVQPICGPRHNQDVKPGTTCEVSGWGQTSVTGDKTDVMRVVDLKVQEDKVCECSFTRYRHQSMICAGEERGRKSTSKGDSGGPLICNGMPHGIVSHGLQKSLFPEVFTRVSYFERWIHKQLQKFELQELPDSSD